MSPLLHDYLVASAQAAPESTAVVMGAEAMTYAQLDAMSNRIARVLVEAGCRRHDRVCVLADKTPATIAALIGVLKAGAAYVPIDVASPAVRTGRMLEKAEPRAIVVTTETLAHVEDLMALEALPVGAALVGLDTDGDAGRRASLAFGSSDLRQADAEEFSAPSQEDDPAQILFTSGSTGAPKGVVVTHRAAAGFIDWAVPHFGISAQERLSGHPPLYFDLSTFDIYGAMKALAELHLVPPATILPRQLAEFILASGLTQLFCVPSVMAYLVHFDALPEDGFPALRRVLWCGEVLPTPVLIEWMRRVPQASFTNLYGPTETTIASSYHSISEVPADPTQPIPIGTACGGEELLVVDELAQPVPDGKTGELAIGGIGLSPGYWREPSMTARSFVSDPRPGHDGERLYRTGDLASRREDGVFLFLGRTDSQIKSRGYRIELGEIEAAVAALPGVAECAVVGLPTSGFEGTSICCAYVPMPVDELDPVTITNQLRRTLPGYMIPARWQRLSSLPRNSNGKIDRAHLREQFSGTVAGVLTA